MTEKLVDLVHHTKQILELRMQSPPSNALTDSLVDAINLVLDGGLTEGAAAFFGKRDPVYPD